MLGGNDPARYGHRCKYNLVGAETNFLMYIFFWKFAKHLKKTTPCPGRPALQDVPTREMGGVSLLGIRSEGNTSLRESGYTLLFSFVNCPLLHRLRRRPPANHDSGQMFLCGCDTTWQCKCSLIYSRSDSLPVTQ
jgi:hypothetical protein